MLANAGREVPPAGLNPPPRGKTRAKNVARFDVDTGPPMATPEGQSLRPIATSRPI
jgi:hypothetical protein